MAREALPSTEPAAAISARPDVRLRDEESVTALECFAPLPSWVYLSLLPVCAGIELVLLAAIRSPEPLCPRRGGGRQPSRPSPIARCPLPREVLYMIVNPQANYLHVYLYNSPLQLIFFAFITFRSTVFPPVFFAVFFGTVEPFLPRALALLN